MYVCIIKVTFAHKVLTDGTFRPLEEGWDFCEDITRC